MENILNRDKDVVWHPFSPLRGGMDILPIDRAEGVYLYTAEGRKILDAVSSWWVNIHGHGNKTIAEAIAAQALKMEHVIFAGFTHEPAVKLCENILSILPSNQQKCFFSDDGSTAVEVGLKMALQFWFNKGIKRGKVIAIDGAYHGDTFGSMSLGERGMFNKPFHPYLFDVETIDFPTRENEEAVYRTFKDTIDQGDVAAFIFEPLIQGTAGMRMYSTVLLDKMINYAQSKEVVCIADEVMTGFGRTGKLFACDYLDSDPDIFCLSKGITGGFLPLGLTTCSARVVEAFDTKDFSKTFFHGHSYTANALSCAAANASFEITTSQVCRDQIDRISASHQRFLVYLHALGSKKILEARSLGTILAIEIDTGSTSYDNELRKKIYPFFMARDILMRPLGNIIYVIPPYVITDDELNRIYNAIVEFMDHEF